MCFTFTCFRGLTLFFCDNELHRFKAVQFVRPASSAFINCLVCLELKPYFVFARLFNLKNILKAIK